MRLQKSFLFLLLVIMVFYAYSMPVEATPLNQEGWGWDVGMLDEYDIEFCERHHELEETKEAMDQALQDIRTCPEEGTCRLEAYQRWFTLNDTKSKLDEEYKNFYYDHFIDKWLGYHRSFYPEESDPFWQWCLEDVTDQKYSPSATITAPTLTSPTTLQPAGSNSPATSLSPKQPTDTPVVTPTPAPADLSIEDAVYILQVIEGANYVALRDIGILVRPYWKGSYPENIPTGYQFQVTLTFDGVAFPAQTKGPGRDFTWVIPASMVGAGEHIVSVTAEIVDAPIVDSDPSNNTFNKTLSAYASQPLRLLFVRVKPLKAMPPSLAELNKLAQESISYLRQVYPVHSVRRVPGSYIVWTLADTRYAVSVAVAKTLVRYNSERCLEFLPNGSSREKPNCTEPKADLAVGVIPYGYYGDMEGWLYGRGSSIWGAWMDKSAQGIGWIASGGAKIDRAAITVVTNPLNPAHEIGHYFNLNDEYSDSLGKRIPYGFIWQDGKFVQIASQEAEYYNFMGNAGVGWPVTQYWVNAQTWNHILNQITSSGQVALPAHAASLQPVLISPTQPETFGPALLVTGVVNQAGQGRIDTVERLHRYEVIPGDQGQWTLEALDAAGGILGGVRFDSYPTLLDDEVPFLVTLPISDLTLVVKIQLRNSADIIAAFERSPAAPKVRITTLPDVSQPATSITWSAQDPDGDATTTTVYYSSDGGNTWHALAQNVSETQVQFALAEIPGGEVQFRLVTSDGFNETTTLLPPITIADHSPLASISTPTGVDFIHGDAVVLQGYADDPEDGTLPPENLRWFNGDNQEIGTGYLLHAQLPVGQQIVTLQATDSAGQSGFASVTINVQPAPIAAEISSSAFNLLVLGILGLILLLIGGSIIFLILFLLLRRKPSAAIQPYQDVQGRWWYQDPQTGAHSYWDGRNWQMFQQTRAASPPTAAAPSVQIVHHYHGSRPPNPGCGSCLIALLVAGLMLVLVFGSVSLIAFQFIPGYSIQPSSAVSARDVLVSFGGGALLGLLGLLMLHGGFKSISTRRALISDDWGRREQTGCAAVLSGIGTAFFGLIILVAGLLLASLAVYQQVLPWLGF
jgi:hypothetical protein